MVSKWIAVAVLIVGMSLVGFAASKLIACTPAQKAEVQQIQQWVEQDLVAGMDGPAIFEDVSARIGGPFAGDLAAVIIDCIQAAIDAKKLAPPVIAHAKLVHERMIADRMARPADASTGDR
jgi:Tfp pilus assembly protein PilV